MIEWREIPETNGNYFASDDGQVWSRPRQYSKGGVLKPWQDAKGYVWVALSVAGKLRKSRVHRLILETFVGPPSNGLECRHLDGDPSNNRLDNLVWGTRSENTYDKVRHGNHPIAARTQCIYGHPFDAANTYVTPDGRRGCRECGRLRYRARRDRIMQEDDRG